MKSEEPFDFDAAYVEERARDQVVVWSDDPTFEENVYHTVSRLPEEIKEFVYEHCRIYSIGIKNFGMVWPGRSALRTEYEFGEGNEILPTDDNAQLTKAKPRKTMDDTWLIVMTENFPKETFTKFQCTLDENIRGMIAHEIAHAWFRHDRMSLNIPEDYEEQAAGQASEWGFVGYGTLDNSMYV